MIRAVVTDIEGTTSSLSFVKDVLFPYAHTRLADFIRAHRHEPAVRAQLDAVRELLGGTLTDEDVTVQLLHWSDQDRKVAPLKELQGMIWEAGFRNGDFTGHVYPDAAETLKLWKARGLGLYIYSSGSVHAQKLLFAHTAWGDLTPLFSGYFDTTTGNKREPDSYRKIASQIGWLATEIVFLSDVKEELDAAKAAGYVTWQLVRAADGTLPAAGHPHARDFGDVAL
ncbi:MAG: haloacid dehalogenase [Acidithiobacillales bacterium SM1_46]|jgi:enolase-phosphatase E1|nr:MAG: haloacid dehalogenase [Acidithiobacillales bacterium SM1_46]